MRAQSTITFLFLLALSASGNSRSEEIDANSTASANVTASANASVEAGTLPTVVVTATRTTQPSYDLPLSIDRVDQHAIVDGNAMVNLSESLGRVPGIVVQNRQNYAQDLQISSRGFGARSTFGVRGIRLYVDGIPATMPDGQGQTSNVDLTAVDRIEVLRGPFSALYGNSSGGVIATFTEDGKPGFVLSPFMQFGSFGFRHYGVKASGQQGDINYVAGVSRFTTDGYREHSAAARNTENAKLRIPTGDDSFVTLIGNAVNMPDVQDPLGLTRAEFESDPRSVDPSATTFNTRKSVSQQQAGLHYEKIIDEDNALNATVYGGHRSTIQYLAVPQGAQLAPTSAGGVIDLSREYSGTDVRWTRQQATGAGKLQWTAGVSYDNLDEDRRGYENFSGTELGVKGNLRRDESNNVYNVDEYVQAQWDPTKRWTLLAGIRNSNITVRSNDHYIATGNGDDSGSVRYHAANPVAGATYKLSDRLHVYASYGKGFETPTLNELSYRPGGAGASGFNFALQPSTSNNYETGLKVRAGKNFLANLAVFHIDTKNELVVLSNTGGRAVYQNAGKTRRDGLELTLQNTRESGLGMLLSASLLRATYAEAFCNGACSPTTQVDAGNRIPGVPGQSAFGELSWHNPKTGFESALELKYGGRIAVDDVNSDSAAAYFIANLRAGIEQNVARWRIKEFVRVDNIADHHYIGSVIVNEGNRRFFEPAPGRNYLAGISAVYSW
jgi:iron complex outermembrane receptor protein